MLAKAEKAVKFIKALGGGLYKQPVVYSSFGKDSMVLLDLIKRAGFKFPVIFHTEPYFPEKYIFANWVIDAFELEVYDYPPKATAVIQEGEEVEIMNFYSTGEGVMMIPTGIKPPKGEEAFICGMDLIDKPTGEVPYPWDLAFVGHKNSDVDPIHGHVPLKTPLVEGKVSFAFPLMSFTDEDIWAYHEHFNVPVHKERYAEGKELADKTRNPDWFPVCTKCFSTEAETVDCPRFGPGFPSQRKRVPFVTSAQILPPYVERMVE